MADEHTGYDRLFRIVVIGDTGTGKSLICESYETGKPCPLALSNRGATIGVEFMTNIVKTDGKVVKLQVWDTSGKERFRSVTSSYFKGASGIMIVYSVNNFESFNNAQYWFRDSRAVNTDAVFVLVAHKSSGTESHVEVIRDEGKALAEYLGIMFVEVDSSTGENVKEAFVMCTKALLDKNDPGFPPSPKPRVSALPQPQEDRSWLSRLIQRVKPSFQVATAFQRKTEATFKESVPKDATSKEAVSMKAVPKDAISKDATSKDAISRDTTPEDATSISKEAGTTSKDAVSKKSKEAEALSKDVSKEAVSKDTVSTSIEGTDQRDKAEANKFHEMAKADDEPVDSDSNPLGGSESYMEHALKMLSKVRQHAAKVDADSQQIEAYLLKAQQDAKEQVKELDKEVRHLKQERDSFSSQLKEGRDHHSQIQSLLQQEIEAKDIQVHQLQTDISLARSELTAQSHWAVSSSEITFTEEELGRGGWGVVRVAEFRGLRVAAKCLHGMILSDYSIRQFSREMSMAATLQHPNLLQFIGATREGDPIILTELMATSLRAVLESGTFSKAQIPSVARDVALGLNYLHLCKPNAIVHRDVSSANVLLEPVSTSGGIVSTWRAKLSDYGSANFVNRMATTAPGCPVYAAPEAMYPHKHSSKMDVYSFGVLLIEMAVGELPETDHRERERQIEHINYIVRWPGLVGLIRSCLRDEPRSRPSVSILLESLSA